MDEAEEEALFARLRASFAALRRDAAAAAGQESGQQSEIMAALTRLEASLRTLASGLDTLAQRADSLDSGIETRVEQAVARNTAALRLDLNRLEAKVASGAPVALPADAAVATSPGRRRGSGVGLALITLLVLIAAGAAAVAFIRTPQTDNLRRLAAQRIAEFRTALAGQRPGTPPATAVPAALTPAETSPTTPAGPKEATNSTPAAPPAPAPSNTLSAANESSSAVDKAASSAAEKAAVPAQTASTAPPATNPDRIIIRATAPSWVEVRERAGNVLLRRTMRPGETWETSGQSNLILSTGNAPGLVLDINGKSRPLPGGRVVRDMPLP